MATSVKGPGYAVFAGRAKPWAESEWLCDLSKMRASLLDGGDDSGYHIPQTHSRDRMVTTAYAAAHFYIPHIE